MNPLVLMKVSKAFPDVGNNGVFIIIMLECLNSHDGVWTSIKKQLNTSSLNVLEGGGSLLHTMNSKWEHL